MTLEEQILAYKKQGKSALEIMKLLRDNNTPISWIEVKTIYNKEG